MECIGVWVFLSVDKVPPVPTHFKRLIAYRRWWWWWWRIVVVVVMKLSIRDSNTSTPLRFLSSHTFLSSVFGKLFKICILISECMCLAIDCDCWVNEQQRVKVNTWEESGALACSVRCPSLFIQVTVSSSPSVFLGQLIRMVSDKSPFCSNYWPVGHNRNQYTFTLS